MRLWWVAVFTAALACAQASFSVTGDVAGTVTFTSEDLAKMPREKVHIPDPAGADVVYEGVPVREILKRAGVLTTPLRGKALAAYVPAKGNDGYQVAFGIAEFDPEFGNEAILVVDQREGKPLPANQGAFRLVCPNDHAGARSVRMLAALEVVRLQK